MNLFNAKLARSNVEVAEGMTAVVSENNAVVVFMMGLTDAGRPVCITPRKINPDDIKALLRLYCDGENQTFQK